MSKTRQITYTTFDRSCYRNVQNKHHYSSNQRLLSSSASTHTHGTTATSTSTINTSTTTTPPTSPTSPTPPTWNQLRILAFRSGIPMIGFGFMDNLVMIEAGEAIDLTLGVTFALSTLTAAGLGQCVSDVAGLTCGGLVDAFVARLNLPHHHLTQAQLHLKTSRICSTIGASIGVVIGCLLGMSTLLWKDTQQADRLKKAKELDTIFKVVMNDTKRIVSSERCSLWMVDAANPNEIWTKFASGTTHNIHVPKYKGVVGSCIQSKTIVNIHDAYSDDRFNPDVDKETGFRTRSIIAVPVFDHTCNKVIGVIELLNKKNDDGTDGTFDLNDAKLLTMLSCHVSQFIRIVNGGGGA